MSEMSETSPSRVRSLLPSSVAPSLASSLAPALSPMLNLGIRVRMNVLGRERHPRYGAREGVIVGRGSPSSWRVQFDERRSVQAIHQSYLECAPVNATHMPRGDRRKRSELAR
jgi:hypothetical protein